MFRRGKIRKGTMTAEKALKRAEPGEMWYYVPRGPLPSDDGQYLLKVEVLEPELAVEKARLKGELSRKLEGLKKRRLHEKYKTTQDFIDNKDELLSELFRNQGEETLLAYKRITGNGEYWVIPKESWGEGYVTNLYVDTGKYTQKLFSRHILMEKPSIVLNK